MSHEHDQHRIGLLAREQAREDATEPGQSSRSARLDAPARPITSGLIQRKARGADGVAGHAEQAVAAASSSSGSALPDTVMGKFETSLGANLSSVRVHTDGASAHAAHAVGARAYTVGQDIHFAAGQYDPASRAGQHLLAHEVAHTVQQRGGAPARQNKLEVSAPHDPAEHEADRAADAMVAGRRAQIITQSAGVARLFDEYSNDQDLKQQPPPPRYTAADGAFGQMAAAMEQSVLGNDAAVPSPQSSLSGSHNNLIECRSNAESANVYYSHHLPSKWNPFAGGNFNAQYAKSAQEDAAWAIGMLSNVRVAGAATGTWVQLLNASNKAWSDLVSHARSMGIDVHNKAENNPLAGLADGQQHTKVGDQTINKDDVAGEANRLAAMAKKYNLKAPDTSGYKTAQREYNRARNELVPQQRNIINTLIPNSIASIAAKKKAAEDEKEKWETIKSAAETFEKGLTIAFGAGEFAEAEGGLGIVKEGDHAGELEKPKGIDPEKTAEKASGYLSKVIDMRINNIAAQIATYNANLKTYSDNAEAQALRAHVDEHKNGLVKLRDLAVDVETKQADMTRAFQEFGKSLDLAMQKDAKTKQPGNDNQQAAALFAKIRTATTTTQGAVDGLSSGGAGDLPILYGDLATAANGRHEDQAGGDGRRDVRSAVFGIEGQRWNAANGAITRIQAALTRRQAEVSSLESTFMSGFAGASGGTDSIK